MDREVVAPPPPVGTNFNATIHSRDSSGNGIIKTKGGYINLGPVREEAVGEYIEALKLPGDYARLSSKSVVSSNYIEGLQEQFTLDFSVDYGDALSIIHERGMNHQNDDYAIVEYIPKYDFKIEDLSLHSVKVDRISSSGNGIVDTGEGEHYNIGPIKDKFVGNEVDIVKTSPPTPGYAVCKTIAARERDYFKNHPGDSHKLQILQDTYTHFEIGMKVQDIDQNDSDVAVVVNLPPIPTEDFIAYQEGNKSISVADGNPDYDPYASVVIVVFEDTLQEYYPEYSLDYAIPLDELTQNDINYYAFPPERLKPLGKNDEEDSEKDDSPLSGPKYTIDQSETRISDEAASQRKSNSQFLSDDSKDNSDTIVDENDSIPKKIKTDSPTKSDNSSNDVSEDLDDLREQAQNHGVEQVPEEMVTSSQTQPQYSRSHKVREYVKTRADGNCEGCGENAPFISTTGEPYLHAHHINELSEGGSDTPETVVALCPNCHYRVHHGEDGDEFNKKLHDIAKESENNRSS